MAISIVDRFGRPLRSLRISVTDRCNLRCHYCMPEVDYAWLPRETLLSFEEIAASPAPSARSASTASASPAASRCCAATCRRSSLSSRPSRAVRDLALTTNGVLLADKAGGAARRRPAPHHRQPRHAATAALRGADAVRRAAAVLAGIDAAARAGFDSLKIDTVVMRGINDDELVDLIEYGRSVGAEMRFIEYMDVGGATRWNRDAVVVAGRDARRHRGALRPDHPARRPRLGPGRPLRPARRHDLRDHRLDDAAVLCGLRPQPADRRRRVADVPLRAAPAPICGARSAPARPATNWCS